MSLLNQEQIKEIIPHRDPFLLIDSIEEMEVGMSAVGTKTLSSDDYWFKGHFPTEPVLPGVLTMEMLAQTAAVCLMSLPEYKGKIGYFAGIDGAKFKNKAVPGDVLSLHIEIIKVRGPICICKGIAKNQNDKIVASAELKFAIG